MTWRYLRNRLLQGVMRVSFSWTSDHSPSEMCTWVVHLRKGSAPPVIQSHQYQPWCWVDACLSPVQLSFSKSQLVLFAMACKKVCWTCTIWIGCRYYLMLLVVTRTHPKQKQEKKHKEKDRAKVFGHYLKNHPQFFSCLVDAFPGTWVCTKASEIDSQWFKLSY